MYSIRGHHLLCLVGYRGMGYSQEYIENMTKIHKTLQQVPDTTLKLVLGPDDLCSKFPKSQKYHCEDNNIYQRDEAILAKLNLKVGQCVTWTQVEKAIRKWMLASDIQHLCHTCSWRSYGVCEAGIHDIKTGKGLFKVE